MSSRSETCIACDEEELPQIVLNCGHNFCLVCASYMALKSRMNGSLENQITCNQCHQTSKLDRDSVQVIRQTIEDRLLPQLSETPIKEFAQKGITFSKNMTSVESFEYQTPSTNVNHKYNTRKQMKQFCKIHAMEEVAFVCMSCFHQPLCLKCILSKQHSDHEVKSFNKAVAIMQQQLDLMQFQVSEGIELIQFKKRTAKDRKILVQECWEKSKRGIEDNFEQIMAAVRKKQSQALEQCNKCYEQLVESVEEQMEFLAKNLQGLKKTKTNLKQLENQDEGYLDFLELYNTCKQQCLQIDNISLQSQLVLDISVSLKEECLLDIFNSIGNMDIKVTKIRQQLKTEICESQYEINLSNCKLKKPPRVSQPPKTQDKLPDYARKFLQKYSHNILKEQYQSISKNTFEGKSRVERSRMMPSDSAGNLHRRKSPLDKLKTQKQQYEHKKGRQI